MEWFEADIFGRCVFALIALGGFMLPAIIVVLVQDYLARRDKG